MPPNLIAIYMPLSSGRTLLITKHGQALTKPRDRGEAMELLRVVVGPDEAQRILTGVIRRGVAKVERRFKWPWN